MMKIAAKTPSHLVSLSGILFVVAAMMGASPSLPQAAAQDELRFSPQVSAAKMAGLVRTADQDADAAFARVAEASVAYFRKLREPQRLRPFVAELLSLEQKFLLGADWWNQADSRQRVRVLFRKHVTDDQRLARDLAAMAQRFQDLLAAQDFILLTEGGIHSSTARQATVGLALRIPSWDGLFDAAIRTAVEEARTDAVRAVAVVAASDVIGDGVEELGRGLGCYGADEGSWIDLFAGLAIDAAVNVAIEQIVDPTDQIVADLGRQLEVAQSQALDGPQGLLSLMRKMNGAHQAARRQWLQPTAR